MAGLICLGVAVFIATLMAYMTLQMRRELAKNQQASEILQAATSLRYLSLEYSLQHGARTQAQWDLKMASFSKMLEAASDFGTREERDTLAELQHDRQVLDALFAEQVQNQAEIKSGPQNADVLQELETRLSGQITNKTQAIISGALALAQRSRSDALGALHQTTLAVFSFGGLLILVMGATIAMTLKSVTRPLERLRQGTLLVGAGNLDFTLAMGSQDEIGELARAFDGMTEKLKRTTVSRDELVTINARLASEISVRQQAEQKAMAQLGRLNLLHQITRSIGERQDLRSIFQVVVRSLEEQLAVDFACICLHDPLKNALMVTCLGTRNQVLLDQLSLSEQALVPIDENGLSRCMRGQLVYEDAIAGVPFPFPRQLSSAGLQALVMAPLLVESTVFGALIVARNQAHSFNSGECEFLRQLSEHVALASKQTQLYGALQQAYDDLRQTQQTVMQQERLRALGQMASGIAHDINNAISPIALYTESMLETETQLSPRGRGYLEIIERSIDDVAATVARMREFYRQREPQMNLRPVHANLLVQQVLDLTRARWSDMPQQRGVVIEARLELQADLPVFMGVEGEIREALTNLVFNAVDAMPEGGVLTLRTRTVQGAPEGAMATPDAMQVLIEVSDTGVGMDDDTRQRCLEPFFTTKGERGTGLGLAMVYGMIERHSAAIEFASAPHSGTTVRMSFMVPAQTAEANQAAGEAVAAPSHLRILIIDDDPMVIRSLQSILEIDGHSVVAADGGQAGIDLFSQAHAQQAGFSVVLTDLGMPYVDGHKVAEAIKRLSPETPILLLTGWGQRLVSEDAAPVHVDGVLSKPPKLKELRSALARIFQG